MPIAQIKEEEMTEKKASPEERFQRGKRLLLYGMFSLVIVTFVAVFLAVYVVSRYIPGGAGMALQTALIVSAIALVASIIVWFIYTKVIAK
jgi:uncharacterized membrane protein YdbT with pleckstrin-like domain